MKLETFFEKFDQFADAPDAVEKMRELIRNFAVRGKLVSQDPRDEPAEALVAKIVAALPDKKSDNPFLAEIEDSITDESEYELPPGWAWLPLGHVGIWATGCGFPMQYQGQTNGDFLFCKVSDMNLPGNEVEIHTTAHSIGADVMKKIRARANPVGTVIFPKIGGAIATHKRRLVIKPTIIDNNCSGIQPIGLTDDRWLLLFMRTLDLTKYQSGTSVPAVSQGSLDPIRIGLPPLAEQKRIVTKVDELMALCDQLETQQQERETRHAALARASLARFAEAPSPANLGFLFHPSNAIPPVDLRKSILTLAVQGKLVPQDPNHEPAVNALRRCGVDLKRWTVAKEEERQEVPRSWTWIRFAGVGEQRLGKMLDAQKNRGKSKPYLRNTNVQWMRFELDDVKEMRVEEREEEQLRLKHGDLLICEGGEPGRCAIWRDKVREMYFQKALHRVRPCEAILSEFLALNLQIDCQNEVLAGYFTGATIKHLTGRSLSAYPIPIPPLAEQRRIVAEVKQLMALVDALETQLAASRATAEKLMEAVVAELTTTSVSNASNGPASVQYAAA